MISEKLEEDTVPRADGGGRAFDANVYFEVLDAMDFSFDEEGSWLEPDFWQEHPNPQTQLTVKRVRMKIDSDPTLRERLDSLIARKRQEWNDREDLEMTISQQPVSWSEWRRLVSSVREGSAPRLLLKYPKWILPFALTYPHRMNRSLSAIVDALIGERAVLI